VAIRGVISPLHIDVLSGLECPPEGIAFGALPLILATKIIYPQEKTLIMQEKCR